MSNLSGVHCRTLKSKTLFFSRMAAQLCFKTVLVSHLKSENLTHKRQLLAKYGAPLSKKGTLYSQIIPCPCFNSWKFCSVKRWLPWHNFISKKKQLIFLSFCFDISSSLTAFFLKQIKIRQSVWCSMSQRDSFVADNYSDKHKAKKGKCLKFSLCHQLLRW